MAIYNKGNWADRSSDYPSRRTLTITSVTGASGIEPGNTITADVTRAEGTVHVVGTAFNHANMDNLETKLFNTFKTVRSETTLFFAEPSTGVISGVTLNQPYQNFDYIGIYYGAFRDENSQDQIGGYTEIRSPGPAELCCSLSYPNANHTKWIMRTAYLILENDNNHSVTFSRNGSLIITISNNNCEYKSDEPNKVRIKKIVGFKL